MFQCGECTQELQQTIPILLNPVTWLIILGGATALLRATALLSKGKKEEKK